MSGLHYTFKISDRKGFSRGEIQADPFFQVNSPRGQQNILLISPHPPHIPIILGAGTHHLNRMGINLVSVDFL